jgi:hypothetical protein
MKHSDGETLRRKELAAVEIRNRMTPLQFASDLLYMGESDHDEVKGAIEMAIKQCQKITEVLTAELACEVVLNADNKESN